MFELGPNAFTVASHITMIVILLTLGVRIMAAKVSGVMGAAMHRGMTAAITIAALSLGIERGYYIAARFLVSSGVNLWTMHPAPEVLSIVVGIGLYGIMIPMLLADARRDRDAWLKVFREVLLLLAFWTAATWVLF